MSLNERQHGGTPVLAGFIERRTQGVAGPPAMLLRAWCRWCCDWHGHGLAGTAVGDYADRAAHCYAPDSQYKETGYHIMVTDTPFSTVRKTMKAATAHQTRAIWQGRINEAVQRLRDQPPPTA